MGVPKPVYNIGDTVYHVSPESELGTVIDILYYFSIDRFKYLVTTGWGQDEWCTEEELSEDKVFK